MTANAMITAKYVSFSSCHGYMTPSASVSSTTPLPPVGEGVGSSDVFRFGDGVLGDCLGVCVLVCVACPVVGVNVFGSGVFKGLDVELMVEEVAGIDDVGN